jgi:hypothetical protein
MKSYNGFQTFGTKKMPFFNENTCSLYELDEKPFNMIFSSF